MRSTAVHGSTVPLYEAVFTWYDGNGGVLSNSNLSRCLLQSIVYVTVEYDGVNYGMSSTDALQKTPITVTPMIYIHNLTLWITTIFEMVQRVMKF